MSPVQSVELLLDDAADDRVRAQWRALAAAGLPGQADHTGPTNAPHVTLAVRRAIDAGAEAALAAVEPLLPVPVPLGGVLLFPAGRGRLVLARAVVAGEALLHLHRTVHEALRGAPVLDGRLDPGRWQPHVTLARRLPVESLPAAVAALRGTTSNEDQAGDLDGDAHATTVRRWDAVARRAWPVAGPVAVPPR